MSISITTNEVSLEILGFTIDVAAIESLGLASIPFIAVFSIVAVYQTSNEFRNLDLEKYFLNYNGPGNLADEEKSKLLAEMDYIISRLEQKISVDDKYAWRWQMKLKSVNYTRSRLIKGQDIQPALLSCEEITFLDKNSQLLKVKPYDLEHKTDPTTVSSIKEKMALYRQHRQEQF